MAFDTHENFKRLTKAGADDKLAEAIIKCQSASQSELATEADIDRLEAKLEGRIGKLEAKVETAMAKQESRLTNKIYAAMAVQATLIIALIKLLPAV